MPPTTRQSGQDIFNQGTPVQTPATRQRRGTLRQVGEFIVPSTTGVVTALREGERPTGRQLGGAALELGSFVVPAGAVARGIGLLGRGARIATQATRATPTPPPRQLEGLQRTLRETGQRVRREGIRGAEVGGLSGALFEGGRALGEEETPITEVIGRGTIGGGAGALGGAVLTPAVSAGTRVIRGITGQAADAFRRTRTVLNPTNREETVDDLANALSESLFEDRAAVVNRLERIANSSRIQAGTDFNERSLLRELVDEGYIPEVDGRLARFGNVIKDIQRRQQNLAQGVRTLASRIRGRTGLSDIQQTALENLQQRSDVDLARAESQFRRLFQGFQKEFGDSLSAEDLNEIRVRMNQQTRAFRGDQFVQDVQNAVGGAVRSRLDEFNTDIRRLNAESARLFRVSRTAQALNNQNIDVGPISQALGRFIGVVGGGAAGFRVAGPGGLVVAGVLANLGARSLANLIRQARFNPQAQEVIRQGIRRDQRLLNRILKNADPADKALIERTIGEAN